MTNILKDTVVYPGIDTEFDAMGQADLFALAITKASDGTAVANGVETESWEEVQWDNDHTGTTSGDTAAGEKTVVMASGNTLVAGDRILIGSDYYYLTGGDDTSITLKTELVADLATDTALDSVGNTGIYKVNVKLADEGEYFFTISHPEFGHTTSKYVVSENSIDTISDDIKKLSGSRMIAIN